MLTNCVKVDMNNIGDSSLYFLYLKSRKSIFRDFDGFKKRIVEELNGTLHYNDLNAFKLMCSDAYHGLNTSAVFYYDSEDEEICRELKNFEWNLEIRQNGYCVLLTEGLDYSIIDRILIETKVYEEKIFGFQLLKSDELHAISTIDCIEVQNYIVKCVTSKMKHNELCSVKDIIIHSILSSFEVEDIIVLIAVHKLQEKLGVKEEVFKLIVELSDLFSQEKCNLNDIADFNHLSLMDKMIVRKLKDFSNLLLLLQSGIINNKDKINGDISKLHSHLFEDFVTVFMSYEQMKVMRGFYFQLSDKGKKYASRHLLS